MMRDMGTMTISVSPLGGDSRSRIMGSITIPSRFDRTIRPWCYCGEDMLQHFAGAGKCCKPGCKCYKYREVTSGNRNQVQANR